jgi:hypothetical protein
LITWLNSIKTVWKSRFYRIMRLCRMNKSLMRLIQQTLYKHADAHWLAQLNLMCQRRDGL